ncbi:MAG: hypothetical protein JOS17DRAFT_180095 [Linnemannia elongata]|nr:MAG: hypothetical protein JOS17DRAFT_180095 [Linnemannia elongata]
MVMASAHSSCAPFQFPHPSLPHDGPVPLCVSPHPQHTLQFALRSPLFISALTTNKRATTTSNNNTKPFASFLPLSNTNTKKNTQPPPLPPFFLSHYHHPNNNNLQTKSKSMATFHSLSPSLGSHQSRLAPDLFSIELELELPQDHFLPAQDIQAQVWTNIIHKLNPDGPEVWAALPMKLSHVIPGKSIAVFATRFQPTGRGEFGLTARWKSHKDMEEWQWAPTEVPITGGGHDKQESNNRMSAGKNDEEGRKNRDVSVTVRVPRTIAGTSSWTIGPQSVLVYGEHGLRTSGVVGVGGPGLYLGNHAAATRARISGYESVLSLVGDLLDFDEKIPESDKDINKNAWMEQAKAASPPKKFSVLSRSSSVNGLDGADAEGYPQQQTNSDQQGQGLTRRSSVTDFMRNYIPGSNSEAIIAGVVDEPVDPPRLTRKSSVTDMMVQAPSSSGPSSKRMSRSSASVSSIASIDEFDAEAPTTPSATTAKANGKSLNKKASTTPAANGDAATNATAATPTATAATPSTPTVPLSKKAQKAAAAAEKAAAATAAATPPAPTAAANSSAALPPVSGNKPKTSTTVTTSGTSPTVSSLAVNSAPTQSTTTTTKAPHPLESSSATNSLTSSLAHHLVASSSSDTPPSSAKVISSLYGSRQSFDSSQILSSLASDPSTTTAINGGKAKIPFTHKVISVAPGAHNRISDAILKEAVEFLQQELEQGKKVLVHCRDGNGRSGSIAVAYIASQLKKQQPWRKNDGGEIYQQALNEIWKWKCDVYPHKGLRESIGSMRW